MEGIYRKLVPVSLWLGVLALLLALTRMVLAKPMAFNLTPHGLLGGSGVLMLLAIAAWCAGEVNRRS